jgi:hypothetical protein
MLPKKNQLKTGEQTVTDINKHRAYKKLKLYMQAHPNTILDKETDSIAKGNTEYEPGNPFPNPEYL